MKRRIGEVPPDCKHGFNPDWCSLCSPKSKWELQSVRVAEDEQCNIPSCQRRARKQTGPVMLCWVHSKELEQALVYNYEPPHFYYRPDHKEEYVYFVRIDQSLKIGYSKNLRTRVRSFAAYGHNVEVLAIEWGDRNLEKKLHRRFSEHLSPVGFSKELFTIHADIIDYIANERTCAFCKNKAQPTRAVCGKHESKELYGEEVIGWTSAHVDTSDSEIPLVDAVGT